MKETCHSGMVDNEVIKTYLKNQASICFTLLYNRYASKIYAKCITLLKDESSAQDATQEIFIKVFMNLSKFGERARFSTWVYSITYNYCIDYIRKKKKLKNIFSDEMEKAPDLPEEEVSDKELLEMEIAELKVVLDRIPIGDKAILLMKYQDDLSIKDIANILDKTESAVKMKIKRAKAKAQKTKKEIGKDGGAKEQDRMQKTMVEFGKTKY